MTVKLVIPDVQGKTLVRRWADFWRLCHPGTWRGQIEPARRKVWGRCKSFLILVKVGKIGETLATLEVGKTT